MIDNSIFIKVGFLKTGIDELKLIIYEIVPCSVPSSFP